MKKHVEICREMMKDVECNDVERSSEYKCPLTDASRCQQSSWDIILCLECNMFLLMSASLSPCMVLVRFVGRSMRAVPEAHVHHVWSSVLVLLNAQCWTCKLPQTFQKCQEVGDPEDMAQDAGQVNLDEDALKEIERDVEHSLDAAHFESKAKVALVPECSNLHQDSYFLLLWCNRQQSGSFNIRMKEHIRTLMSLHSDRGHPGLWMCWLQGRARDSILLKFVEWDLIKLYQTVAGIAGIAGFVFLNFTPWQILCSSAVHSNCKTFNLPGFATIPGKSKFASLDFCWIWPLQSSTDS